jgi:hypothetical protein
VPAHALAEQLLPAIAVFRHGGVGIGLLERRDVSVDLLIRVVDTGRAGVEEAVNVGVSRRHQQVRVDEHREHAVGLVGFDEAHAAHVGREVVDGVDVLDHRATVVEFRQVSLREELDALRNLVPLIERLDVSAAHLQSVLYKRLGEVTPDKAARTGDKRNLYVRMVAHSSTS